MSTEGISLNIVENATTDKLSKGDLRKAGGRLERRWNPKTREDKVEVYTKFLNYKLVELCDNGPGPLLFDGVIGEANRC